MARTITWGAHEPAPTSIFTTFDSGSMHENDSVPRRTCRDEKPSFLFYRIFSIDYNKRAILTNRLNFTGKNHFLLRELFFLNLLLKKCRGRGVRVSFKIFTDDRTILLRRDKRKSLEIGSSSEFFNSDINARPTFSRYNAYSSRFLSLPRFDFLPRTHAHLCI